MANLALDGGDPRLHQAEHEKQDMIAAAAGPGGLLPHQRAIHDPSVSFEEYHHYAQKTRAEELNHPASGNETKLWSLLFPSKSSGGAVRQNSTEDTNGSSNGHDEKDRTLSTRGPVSDEEWNNASRALRTATRGAIFYLITTDILGPFSLVCLPPRISVLLMLICFSHMRSLRWDGGKRVFLAALEYN